MPELPEAETIARTLGPHVSGNRIIAVRFLSARAHRGRPFTLAGCLIRGVRRHGKLGPDALDLPLVEFAALFRGRRADPPHRRGATRHSLLSALSEVLRGG